MTDDRPHWAQRMASERTARGWSQADAVRALRAHSTKALVEEASLLRQWKRWEAGEKKPSDFYQSLIAATFGTVTHALFPVQGRRNGEQEIVAVSGLETLDIVRRLQASDVDEATMDALRITIDRLCSEYASMPAEQLLIEGRAWLKRVAQMQSQRLSLKQHQEVLSLAGWLALLVGCIEFDLGDKHAADATRRAALSLGMESGDTHVAGWAYEMNAWAALTAGDFRGVIEASRTGSEIAQGQGVAVQLAAQEAKAWARIGDRRQAEVALDRGRRLLEGIPHPSNLANHFVVDPAKYDFYAMDCYRALGERALTDSLAQEVIHASTDYDGTELAPMRIAEARVTLGVVAARNGDLDSAAAQGRRALEAQRRSLPSLLSVGRELGKEMVSNFPDEPETMNFIEQLRSLSPTLGIESSPPDSGDNAR